MNAKKKTMTTPKKPRTKSSPQTWVILLDPTGGYIKNTKNAFEIVLKLTLDEQCALRDVRYAKPEEFVKGLIEIVKADANKQGASHSAPTMNCSRSLKCPLTINHFRPKLTPEKKRRLIAYLTEDPQGFIHDLDFHLLMRIEPPDWTGPIHYGPHARTHGIEAAIKYIATRLYVIEKYWESHQKAEAPEEYYDLFEAISDNDDELYSNPVRLTQLAILRSPLGQLATEYGLRFSKLRPTDYKKCYLPRAWVETLKRSLDNADDSSAEEQTYRRYTSQWLKLLGENREYWIHHFRLNNQ